jgi:hypothetical protein
MLSDTLVKLLLSIIAAVVGGLIFRWWDRARALVLVKGFTNIVSKGSAPCPDSLPQMTTLSWTVETLAATERLDRIHYAHWVARTERARCLDGIDILSALRSRFAGASTTDEAIDVLSEIFKRSELANAVAEGVRRSVLPAARGGGAAQVNVQFEDRSDNGRFILLFHRDWGHSVGENLNDQPALRAQMDSWLDAVRTIDKDALLGAIDALPPLLQEAAALHQAIADTTRPILQAYSQWFVKIAIVNYGSKDMVIWPDATMVVRPRGAKAIRIPCLLESVEDPESRRLRDIVGVEILAKSENLIIWGRTAPQQRAITKGELLRSAFESGTAVAQMAFHITKRRNLRGFGTHSANVPFTDGYEGWRPSSTDWDDVYPDVPLERERSERLAALKG